MSLKTPESQLRELGLSEYSIVYDDDECEPDYIAWLYKDRAELGHWDSDMKFSGQHVPELEVLSQVVRDLRS